MQFKNPIQAPSAVPCSWLTVDKMFCICLEWSLLGLPRSFKLRLLLLTYSRSTVEVYVSKTLAMLVSGRKAGTA